MRHRLRRQSDVARERVGSEAVIFIDAPPTANAAATEQASQPVTVTSRHRRHARRRQKSIVAADVTSSMTQATRTDVWLVIDCIKCGMCNFEHCLYKVYKVIVFSSQWHL